MMLCNENKQFLTCSVGILTHFIFHLIKHLKRKCDNFLYQTTNFAIAILVIYNDNAHFFKTNSNFVKYIMLFNNFSIYIFKNGLIYKGVNETMTNKWVAILGVGILALSLTACSDSKENENAPDEENTQQEATNNNAGEQTSNDSKGNESEPTE